MKMSRFPTIATSKDRESSVPSYIDTNLTVWYPHSRSLIPEEFGGEFCLKLLTNGILTGPPLSLEVCPIRITRGL